MKTAMLSVFVIIAFTTVQAFPRRPNIASSLSRTFMISVQDVEMCISKAGAELDDFEAFETAINDDSYESNGDGVRKASCALVCCAHVKGVMTDGKINVPFINKIISESKMPQHMQSQFISAIYRCNDKTKSISNQCDLGYAFIICALDALKDMKM